MKNHPDRRQFTASAASVVMGASCAIAPAADAISPSVSQKRLVVLGMNALARSPELNYFADGHRGASMISAYLMCANNQLEENTTNRIVQLFDLNWAKTRLCKSFPESDPLPEATAQIGKTLAKGGGVLRQVGHDAIFAMHAIKAIRLMPELATPERVAGICRLIQAFKPWRDVKPDKSIEIPRFSDSQACARFILQEASHAIDRFVGFGQGFAGHMLTFGQSLVELAAMGDEEWAESCRVAFQKYVTVTRLGPREGDRKIKEHVFSKLRPDQTAYWNKRGDKTLGLGHVFKYPYAYYDLIHRARDAKLQKEFESKAWRLF